MANPYQFQYPEVGWSTGRMRKRGEKLAMMPAQDIVDPSRGLGLQGGGGGFMAQPIQERLKSKLAPGVAESISDQFGKIKQHLNDIGVGDATMDSLKKLMKKFGWTGDPEKGQFTDPEGKSHNITADTDATGSQGSDAAGSRR